MSRKTRVKKTIIGALLCATPFLFGLSTTHAESLIDENNYDQVLNIQMSLANAGQNLSVDGVWGPQTKNAIIAFQEYHGIATTGEVDNDTMYLLKRFQSDVVSRGFTRSIVVEATGYTRYDEGCSDYTATGEYLRRGIIAVDPSIIPMGTRVFIPGYGIAVAADTGGAIRGNKIDLAFDSRSEAFAWGRRTITMFIL